jgi:hypothetical protein
VDRTGIKMDDRSSMCPPAPTVLFLKSPAGILFPAKWLTIRAANERARLDLITRTGRLRPRGTELQVQLRPKYQTGLPNLPPQRLKRGAGESVREYSTIWISASRNLRHGFCSGRRMRRKKLNGEIIASCKCREASGKIYVEHTAKRSMDIGIHIPTICVPCW